MSENRGRETWKGVVTNTSAACESFGDASPSVAEWSADLAADG